MSRTPKEIIERWGQLDKVYEDYKPLKKTCTQLAYPQRADLWEICEDKKGDYRGQRIYDPTAVKDLEIWGNGIIGNYAPKDINWFKEEMPIRKLMESKTVRKWLQDTDEHLRFTVNRSDPSYHEQKKVAIMDSGCIGDSFMYIDEDIETGKIMCKVPHPRQFRVQLDYWGRTIEIQDRFEKSLLEIEKEWGSKALTPEQRETLKTIPDQLVQVIHATDRNPDYDPTRMGVKYMRWRTYYINVEGKLEMERGGYRTLNPVPWSLNRPSHEVYGRGIVSQMLIEIMTANYMSKDMLLVSQLAARPPSLLTSALKNRQNLLKPGNTEFVNTQQLAGLKMGDLVTRLVDTTGYPFGVDMLERWQTLIDERFGIPLILSYHPGEEKAEKTATEIRDRQGQRITLMAPFLASLGSTTDRELDRIYSIELDSGRAPEPPMEVIEATSYIDIQYTGPLHQLMKQYYETGNLLNTIANIQAVAATPGFEDTVLTVDGDELMRKILESGNTPEEIILSAEEVAEVKAMIAAQQELVAGAEMAANTIPALQGKTEEGSPLALLQEAVA